MANLKEVRERITSVKSTQQITKAMKMVAAAKLRKAQEAITMMRPYSNKLNEMLSNILSNMNDQGSSSFGIERPVSKALMVVVTSDRGLCGAFNSNIIKGAIAAINDRYLEVRKNGNLDILFVGKKGFEYFKTRFSDCNLIESYIGLFSDLSFNNINRIPNLLMERFESQKYDRIEVAYGEFKNAAMQFPKVEQFLPVLKLETEEDSSKSLNSDYIFEPAQEELLEQLVPSILQTQFLKYVLDTNASEHGARMTAMDSATENAEELLKDLKINYNKARQEAITNELSEIVSGAMALNG